MLKKSILVILVSLLIFQSIPYQVLAQNVHIYNQNLIETLSTSKISPLRTIGLQTNPVDPLGNLPADHPLRFGPGVAVGVWSGEWVEILVSGEFIWAWVDDYQFNFLYTFEDGTEKV